MDEPQFRSWLTELKDNRTRGASELGRQCLEVASRSALSIDSSDSQQLNARLVERSRAMIAARASMAPIAHLLDRWCRDLLTIRTEDLQLRRREAACLADRLITESLSASAVASAAAAKILGNSRILLTHSYSSTVLKVFAALQDRPVSAIVTESRPLTTAEHLSRLGIPVTLITDAQIGLSMRDADAVLVGTDGILADGSVVNKAGTYLLALAAFDQGVPFYVCTESFKRWPSEMAPNDLGIEENDPGELSAPGWSGVEKRNIYFDTTPSRLITRCITEADGTVEGENPIGPFNSR